MSGKQSRGRRISLQRKLGSAIFLALASVLCGLEYANFRQEISDRHEELRASSARADAVFRTLLTRSAQELVRIANHYNIRSASADNLGQLAESSLLSGIESVHFFNAEGQALAALDQHQTPTPAVQPLIREVVRQRQPQAGLECRDECLQRAYVPVIAADGSELIVNINRSIALVVQDFYAYTQADVALLREKQDQPAWQLLIASNASSTKDRVPALTAQLDESGASFVGDLDGTYVSARRTTLNSLDGEPLTLLISQHQPGTRQLIRDKFLQASLTIALSLLFSMLAITLILKPPLSRVLRLASILRQLPESRFTQAREQLQRVRSQSRWLDETDVLRSSLGSVIDELEALNNKNAEQRHKLKEKIVQLTEATHFNDMLLDASPLIIIIHDREGQIESINQLGREIIGADRERSLNINDWVRSDLQSRRLSESLQVLLNDEHRRVQGELPLYGGDGLRLEILWVHRAIRVQGQLRILSMGMDVTEQHEASRSLQWLGRHDRVTGLLNRLSFIDEVRLSASSHHDEVKLELLLIDIDDFAKFNDRFDFATGDKLLLALARHISLTLPDSSLKSRSGSGEFSVLLERDPQQSEFDYRQMLEKLTRYEMDTDHGKEMVHLSVVVNSLPPGSSGAIDELLSDTTSIMSRVKSRARGQLFFATEEHIDRLSRQQKYHTKDLLQKALDENRLLLFYQPIVDLRNQRLSHCECLVRMLDEEGQFIPPNQFLGVAAELGLMSQIDFAVMEMAMLQQRRWQDRGIELGLSINMTAHSMELPDFESQLHRLLEQTGADPHRLIFEVVETDALESISTAKLLLKNFRAIGAKIALDDFGVGFTSFEYIRELPVDYIKIDQSFVRFIHERPNDQALVRSMVEMSHSLNKQVIVEGVETRQALQIVRDMGVEYAQGYYISRPVPLSALNLNMPLAALLR